MENKLTWKEVFACHGWWGHISIIRAAAESAHYKYYEWNGWVYEVDGGKTDILSETL